LRLPFDRTTRFTSFSFGSSDPAAFTVVTRAADLTLRFTTEFFAVEFFAVADGAVLAACAAGAATAKIDSEKTRPSADLNIGDSLKIHADNYGIAV
jgi:hypothetical protein